MNRTKLSIGFAAFAAMLLMNFIYAAKGYGNSSSFVQSMIASVSGGSSGSSGGGGMTSSAFVGEEEWFKTEKELSKITCGYSYDHHYVWETDLEGNMYRSFVGVTTYCNGKAISKYTGVSNGVESESYMQSYSQGNKCESTLNPFSTCTVRYFTCEFYVSCR